MKDYLVLLIPVLIWLREYYELEQESGRHLIIDANFGDKGRIILSQPRKVDEYLVKVTDVAKMTLAVPPVSLKFPVDDRLYNSVEQMLQLNTLNESSKQLVIDRLKAKDDGNLGGKGVSGTAIWVESHCALHSWTEYDYVSLDLFSCKEFDVKPVLDFTKDFFKLNKMNVIVIDRFMYKPAKIIQYTISDMSPSLINNSKIKE